MALNELRPIGEDPVFPGVGMVYSTPEGFNLNEEHGGRIAREYVERTFDAREDDIYVVSFPKTGTTWAQEMVYLVGTDLDFEKAKSTVLAQRFPYLELKRTTDNQGVEKLTTAPRFIKSHYPYCHLPPSIVDKKCKIIYTIRNPKDTLVSYYHFSKMNPLFQYNSDFEVFMNYFMQDKVAYTPYWKHIQGFWERRNQENILILVFEEMKRDPQQAVRQVANFLGKKLTEEQVAQVANHCDFDKMKKNPTTNYEGILEPVKKTPETTKFMRKGQVGDWKNYFTPSLNKTFDEYLTKYYNIPGLQFIYE